MTSPVQEVRTFKANIPANTPVNSPVIVLCTMPAREVAWIKWRVPPGPVGFMGWRLSMSNGQVLLPAGGGYIVTDNDGDTWELYDQPDSGAWEVTGYNTDIYDHAVYLDFGVTVPGSAVPPVTFISSSALSQPVPVSVPSSITVPPITVAPITVPSPVTVPGG